MFPPAFLESRAWILPGISLPTQPAGGEEDLPTSRGDLVQQKHNSAGTFLWEAQKSRTACVTILMHLDLQIQQQTSHPEIHTLGRSNKQKWVNYGLAKAILNCCCDRRAAEAAPTPASLGWWSHSIPSMRAAPRAGSESSEEREKHAEFPSI